ncbi:N-acetylglutamate synthase, GNAT family [Catalinimonas alkaloidigena]|uniref:N-acetylglutamate synthase, GNAT family n=1 Tax=Catalinimonas alkaloidigena TaxID=1075417 RepID=A0A1G9E5Y2_9BACT|nr:GNAT family N-acetyltransferase [Catalinimonas alkaloidigena]SDK71529.1 N-acetylglutamate synthase, GNAT family [Catalinimonas alkaloidigena]
MKDYTIRKATREDVPALFRLIKELALFEKAPREVENSEEQLRKDGFGSDPLFGAYVAEIDGKVVGAAFYYWRYSTWKGKRLYLEDLIVEEDHRRKGIGNALFNQMIRVAQENDCNGMSLQVLEWNEPAINFYKRQFMTLDPEWVNAHMTRQQVESWRFDEEA